MCAIVGCSSTPSARDASDLRRHDAMDPNAPIAASGGENPSFASADAASASSSSRSLPWLSASLVGAAVRAHRQDFQACQALGDVLSQREDGAVTVGWAVRANGSVRQVTLGRTTFHEPSINDCVLRVARQVRFPASAAPAQVSWTVQFRGAAQEPLADATRR
jgi:uncharacterized membrane protein